MIDFINVSEEAAKKRKVVVRVPQGYVRGLWYCEMRLSKVDVVENLSDAIVHEVGSIRLTQIEEDFKENSIGYDLVNVEVLTKVEYTTVGEISDSIQVQIREALRLSRENAELKDALDSIRGIASGEYIVKSLVKRLPVEVERMDDDGED